MYTYIDNLENLADLEAMVTRCLETENEWPLINENRKIAGSALNLSMRRDEF